MKSVLIILAGLVPLIAASSSVTTGSIVRSYGYPFEEHRVQTADGYVLGIHRIPYSPRVGSTGRRPVAFLMHGLLCSSSDWVLLGPDNGLAFLLSDAGFDVWMGNARGNTYSRKHVSHNPLLPGFWNFDWHEIAIYDLPATIDYVLYVTGENQVNYFGHSQGTTTFLLLNTLNLKFKSRIRSAHLLAPVAYMDHMESPLAKVAGPLMGHPNALGDLFGNFEFLPNSKAMELMGYLLCKEAHPTSPLCSNVLFLIAGFDDENLNATLIPEIMATTPAGSSSRQFMHYLQEYQSGKFRHFDFGLVVNKSKYGSTHPPNYQLSKLDVPIYLYFSDNDYFASLVDVSRLIREIPSASLKRAYRVPHPRWNHLDFLWGLNIKPQVYNAVMADVLAANKA